MKFIAFAKEGPELQVINKNSLKTSLGNKVGLFQVNDNSKVCFTKKTSI